jgi:hypothetical protein
MSTPANVSMSNPGPAIGVQDGARAAPPEAVENSAGPSTADGLKLLRAFLNIRDATLRRSVVQLVELLAASHPKL